ncbi:MAG: periplasmic amino acid-binding protein [Tardiphaga sp.]|jgi:branched-chain amino acid transport system substrate-binding protein|nr:periplasmic amino acid-binding protein [Tardiphaga sp.]
MRKSLSNVVAAGVLAASAIGTMASLDTASAQARDEIVVGYIMSATGANASLGVHYRNAQELFPTSVSGVKVRYVVRDDGSDSTQALNLARQMISEEKIDVLLGPSLTTSALSVLQLVNDSKVPEIATCPMALDATKTPWTFSTVQTASLMMSGVVDSMVAKGIKKVGFIGFSDSFGDQILQAFQKLSEPVGITITSEQRYARADTSVQAQVLRLIASKPDAILVGGAGSQAALPGITLKDRGFTGQLYNTHGAVNPDFLRIGAAKVDGEIAPTGPVFVFDQLPASNPTKAVGTDFMTKYLAKFGEQNRNGFAGYAYDGYLIFEAAAKVALTKAKPGTQEFRNAFRDAAESNPTIVGTHGNIKMTPTDHYGRDKTGLVLVQVANGGWTLVNQ